MNETLPVLVLVSDLIFSSRISAEARAAGVAIRMIRQPQLLVGQRGSRLIVDLNLAGATAAAADWQKATGMQVVGFVSHMDQEAIAAAMAAGLEVLPRSKFVQVLPALLKSSNPA